MTKLLTRSLAVTGSILLLVSCNVVGHPAATPVAPHDPLPATASTKASASTAPTAPPIRICGVESELSGPSIPPRGAVTVPAGSNAQLVTNQLPGDTTYWFAPGIHTLGAGEYAQIRPGPGDTFVGAPGAVLSGSHTNDFAFEGTASGVTVEYLEIENFTPPGNEGAVNASAAPAWTVEHNLIRDNTPGSGLYIGTDNRIMYNCISANGQQGFGTYSTHDVSALTTGPSNLNVSYNEISYNNTCNWENDSPDPIPLAQRPGNCKGAGEYSGCGCTAGGKFWTVDGAVVENNYIHDNYSVGLWADTNNTGFTIEHNYLANNWSGGLNYEISYNALINDNTFVDNSRESGPATLGFPSGAIYISDSGGDRRVPGRNSGLFQIEDNVFTNNWGGVVLWEDSDRFCSDGWDGLCTLVDPAIYTLTACRSHLASSSPGQTPDYYDNCRWKTQNVMVSGNQFQFDPAAMGPECTVSRYCGFNALFSLYGSTPPYRGWITDESVSGDQNNVFRGNTYIGPWRFMAFSQGDTVGWSQWTHGFKDENGSDAAFNGQDAGSTDDAS